MAEFTYYDILGLSFKASDLDIKEAYKERARYYHPDVTSLAIEVAQAQLKIINEAYRALSSAEKRKEYDADLIARKELSLLGEFSEVVEDLFKGKFKRAAVTLQEVVAKAPESDIPHGLLATAFHMQAISAYESKKYEVAQGLLKQALDIGFEDLSLRKSLKYDLAVVEHRLRAPVPLTDLGTIVKEMAAVNKHNAIRALTALTIGDFEGDRGKAIAAAVNLAGRSLHRDVRVVALKALSAIDEKNKGVYALFLDLYGPGKEGHKLETLAKLKGQKVRPLASLLIPFFWDTNEKLRLAALGFFGSLHPNEPLEEVFPLLWSTSPEIQGKGGWILKRMGGGLGALFAFEPGPSFVKSKKEELLKANKAKAKLYQQIALFWEQPGRRGEVLRDWLDSKNPGLFLDFAMVAFYARTTGTNEAVRDFLSAHGEAALGMLLEATKDEDYMIRLHSLVLLKELKPPETVDVMLAALSDARPLILKEAIEALGGLGDGRAIDPLRSLFRHEDGEIATLAQDAVNKIRNYTPPTIKRKKKQAEKSFDDWTD
ncbi:MAG TPA: hypothetical protein DD435_02910 [Cyanobacteria bacterium UBA8530]|nr:hypothetical protein [Cyanobacteria bacterium UBA8530]